MCQSHFCDIRAGLQLNNSLTVTLYLAPSISSTPILTLLLAQCAISKVVSLAQSRRGFSTRSTKPPLESYAVKTPRHMRDHYADFVTHSPHVTFTLVPPFRTICFQLQCGPLAWSGRAVNTRSWCNGHRDRDRGRCGLCAVVVCRGPL